MQPPPAATAAQTSAHAGHGVTLADAVAVAVMALDGETVDVTLADALLDALAVGDGVGWQASQQVPWSVALPSQLQKSPGQASGVQYELLPHALLLVRKRGAAAAAERSSAPAMRRRRRRRFSPHV